MGRNKISRAKNYDAAIQNIVLPTPCWQSIQLPFVLRNIYWPNQSLLSRSFEEVDHYRILKNISVSGYDVHKPCQSFLEANFPPSIYYVLSGLRFEEPTPIQAQIWPIALSGRDAVGIAVTGSGKTLAFVLPAIAQILYNRQYCKGKGPLVLILAPTHELAIQIHEVVRQFCHNTDIHSLCIYGGRKLDVQGIRSYVGVDLIVATPGRLMDIVSRGLISINFCSYVVIDEADKMTSQGFIPQIQRILYQIRPDRQLLMFSATWDDRLKAFGSETLKNPIQVTVGSVNQNILQLVIVCEEQDKIEKVFHLLKEINRGKKKKTLLFVASKKRVKSVYKALISAGFSAESFHGGFKQWRRERTLEEFRTGRTTTLVTTDVASRGLDIPAVRHVIVYDFPKNPQVYVHRIGRTGRAGKHGTAYTLFTEKDHKHVDAFVEILKSANQRVPWDLIELKKQRAPWRKRKWDAEME